MPIKINSINSLMFICIQKINFIPPLFVRDIAKILQTLSTLGMPDYDQ